MAQRGGTRPGAGAPRGNINALSSGRYSARYSDAWLIVQALPRVRQHIEYLRAASDPDARDQHRRYLDAAAWTVETYPDLPAELEQHILVYLTPRAARVEHGRVILHLLAQPPDARHPLQRALEFTILLQRHDPVLRRVLTHHIWSRFRTAPVLKQKPDFTQSDNQTINTAP